MLPCVRLQHLQEQPYLALPVCVWYFHASRQWYGCQCLEFLMCADVDACNCTWRLYRHYNRVAAGAENQTCISVAPGFFGPMPDRVKELWSNPCWPCVDLSICPIKPPVPLHFELQCPKLIFSGRCLSLRRTPDLSGSRKMRQINGLQITWPGWNAMNAWASTSSPRSRTWSESTDLLLMVCWSRSNVRTSCHWWR